MTHWSEKYLGQQWTPEHNCYYWFRRIMVDEFGRTDLPEVAAVPQEDVTRLAAREFTDQAIHRYGWNKVQGVPQEGDAVYLTRGRAYNTHIGVVFFRDGKQFILHALKGMGVVVSDWNGLAVNFLRERGYWRYARAL